MIIKKEAELNRDSLISDSTKNDKIMKINVLFKSANIFQVQLQFPDKKRVLLFYI